MVQYLLSVKGIADPKMPDSTYGFAMAVFRGNEELAKIMLDHYLKNIHSRADERDRNYKLAKAVILELDANSSMKSVLTQALADLDGKFGPVETESVASAPFCKK